MKKLLLTLGSAASIAAPLATVVACGDKEETTVTHSHAYTFSATVDGLGLLEDPSAGGDDYPYTIVEQNGIFANLGNIHKVSEDFDGTTYGDLLNDNSSITISESYDTFFGLEKIVNTEEEGYYELDGMGMGPDGAFTKEAWDSTIASLDSMMMTWITVPPFFTAAFGSEATDALPEDADEYWNYLLANYENVDWAKVELDNPSLGLLHFTTYDPYLDGEIKLYDADDKEILLTDTLPEATEDALDITIKVESN